MSDPVDLARLRWQCRRGMRELDEVFLMYLEGEVRGAGAERREAFARLLAYPDPVLYDWLFGAARPRDAELAREVDRVRAAARP